MTRKPRGLRPEEEALWQHVVKSATPMKRPAVPTRLENKAAEKPAPENPVFSPRPFRVGETAVPRFATEHQKPKKPIRMDRKAFSRMKRGKANPEARIDLHGMTVAAAQSALTGFLLRAFGEEKRLVLVITGKGRHADDGGPVPQRRGVLKQHLPEWLTGPPLSSVVLEWTSAHQRHGGSGAFYVYLSRRR